MLTLLRTVIRCNKHDVCVCTGDQRMRSAIDYTVACHAKNCAQVRLHFLLIDVGGFHLITGRYHVLIAGTS
jgi:hypothetical protein